MSARLIRAGVYLRACRTRSGRSIDEIALSLGLEYDNEGQSRAAAAGLRNEIIMAEQGYPGDYSALVDAMARLGVGVDPVAYRWLAEKSSGSRGWVAGS